MLRIRSDINLVNGRFSVTFQLDESSSVPAVSQELQKKLNQFGPFQVDFGGTLTIEGEDPVVIGEDLRYMPDTLPFSRSFSLADYDFAADLAAAYQTLIRSNINTALTTFVAQTATPSSTVFTLPEAP